MTIITRMQLKATTGAHITEVVLFPGKKDILWPTAKATTSAAASCQAQGGCCCCNPCWCCSPRAVATQLTAKREEIGAD
jgi:hypothetical protein